MSFVEGLRTGDWERDKKELFPIPKYPISNTPIPNPQFEVIRLQHPSGTSEVRIAS
jgi:hypothetical protein